MTRTAEVVYRDRVAHGKHMALVWPRRLKAWSKTEVVRLTPAMGKVVTDFGMRRLGCSDT